MKKSIITLAFASLILPAFADSNLLTFTNTFGGNEDSLDGYDLIDDGYFSFGNRSQLDLDSKYVNGRIRFDFSNLNFSGEQFLWRFRGFVQTGFPYFSGVFGNSFFNHFDIKAAEIYALDLNPNYGRIIKDGLGFYSEIPFSKKDKLKLGAAVESDSIFGKQDFALDLGFNFVKKNLFNIGGSFRDITSGAYGKYSILGGFNLGDFTLNGGFIYNNTDLDVLPAETKSSLQVSLLYSNKDSGISASTSIVSGLNSQYLRGTKEKTASYANNGIPFMAAFSLNYSFKDDLDFGLRIKYSDLLNGYNSADFIVYPNVNYVFYNQLFELNGGLKFDFTNYGGKKHMIFSLPVSLKFSIGWL